MPVSRAQFIRFILALVTVDGFSAYASSTQPLQAWSTTLTSAVRHLGPAPYVPGEWGNAFFNGARIGSDPLDKNALNEIVIPMLQELIMPAYLLEKLVGVAEGNYPFKDVERVSRLWELGTIQVLLTENSVSMRPLVRSYSRYSGRELHFLNPQTAKNLADGSSEAELWLEQIVSEEGSRSVIFLDQVDLYPETVQIRLRRTLATLRLKSTPVVISMKSYLPVDSVVKTKKGEFFLSHTADDFFGEVDAVHFIPDEIGDNFWESLIWRKIQILGWSMPNSEGGRRSIQILVEEIADVAGLLYSRGKRSLTLQQIETRLDAILNPTPSQPGVLCAALLGDILSGPLDVIGMGFDESARTLYELLSR